MNNDFLTSLIVAEPCRDTVYRVGHQTPYPPQQEIANPLYFSTPDAICESAARLLFISVKWARNIPSFVNLPFRDQVILLEEGWRELFILGAVQWNMPLEVAPLLAAAGMHVDNTPAEKLVATMADIRMLQEISARFRGIQVGEAEYACLKAVVLFKSGSRCYFHLKNLYLVKPQLFYGIATLQGFEHKIKIWNFFQPSVTPFFFSLFQAMCRFFLFENPLTAQR